MRRFAVKNGAREIVIIISLLLVVISVIGMANEDGKGNDNLMINKTFTITVDQWLGAQLLQPTDTASTVTVGYYDEDYSNVPPYNAGWEIIELYSNATYVKMEAEADFGANTSVVDENLNYLKLDVYDVHNQAYPSNTNNQISIKIKNGTYLTSQDTISLEAGNYDSPDGKAYYLGISVSAKKTMPVGTYPATLLITLMPSLP